ncbi:hypothetical protein KAR91_44805 [Candidatus Pacearchaeota archaeon]|nr:hypothetical protein [Candidatus Pacearchaeota archaeon]
MPRFHPYLPSFNTGELTERLAARVDFVKYPSGVATMENLIPLSEGGAMRRSGSRYVAATNAGATKKGRLKKFQFSTSDNYILESSDALMRFFRNQKQITIPNTDASIINGTFDSDISSWTDKSTGTGAIAHEGTLNALELTGAGAGNAAIAEQAPTLTTTSIEHVLRFRVIGAPGDFITVRIGSSSGAQDFLSDFDAKTGFHSLAFTPTSSPFYLQFESETAKAISVDDVVLVDNAPIEITTPWAEADLYDVEGPQSTDVLYQFHENYPTYRLARRGHTSWSCVEVAWQDGPYLALNATPTTLTFAAATGLGVAVAASSTAGINEGLGFLSTDVGRSVRLSDNAVANWGWAVIVAVTDTTNITVDIKRTVVVTTAEASWRLGAWSATTGYPSVGGFYEQRLVAAGTTDFPQTIWHSQTAFADGLGFEDMTPDSDPTFGTFDGTVQDDDAFDFTLTADDVNPILWMTAGENALSVGTSGGEWTPTSVGAVLTPSDRVYRRQTTHGSAKIQPVRIDRAVLFTQRAKRKILEFSVDDVSLNYEAFDMTRLAQHVNRGGVVEMDFAEEPDSLIWIVRNDGYFPSMTFRRQEDVVGWARHFMGGSFGSGKAVVESIAVIPGTNGAGQVHDSTARDEVWMMVKRTIDGATARYVEFLERDFETGDDQDDLYYLDSLFTYDGSLTSTITGLDHLEGESVGVWADGAIQENKTVVSGSITLDIEASTVQVGLRYQHTLKTLKLEGGSRQGTSVSKTKQIFGFSLILLNSHTVNIISDSGTSKKIDFRVVSDPMDAGAPLFTGESKYVEFDDDWDQDPRITLQSDDPAPFTLLAIAPKTHVNPTP